MMKIFCRWHEHRTTSTNGKETEPSVRTTTSDGGSPCRKSAVEIHLSRSPQGWRVGTHNQLFEESPLEKEKRGNEEGGGVGGGGGRSNSRSSSGTRVEERHQEITLQALLW